jgi:VIT1/CCC1 family predicted Fe2+/Mn2+ transporter
MTLYVLGCLVVLIPILYVMMSEKGFSASVSHLFIKLAFVFFLVGKLLHVFKRKKANKPISWDIGIVLVLVILLFSYN